jgi:hypothetical protein
MLTDSLRPVRRPPTARFPAKYKRLAVRIAASTDTKTAAYVFAVRRRTINKWKRLPDDTLSPP